jgi:hypothetical protein
MHFCLHTQICHVYKCWPAIYIQCISICYTGEQGITGMLPLYLVDKDISANDITFWAGMLGQGLSILGSLLGGWLITYYRYHLPTTGIIYQIINRWEN